MPSREDELAVKDLLTLLGDALTIQKTIQASNPANDKISCDEVYPNVLVGNVVTAMDKQYLVRTGVSHVVNTAEGKASSTLVDTDQEFYRDVGIRYLGVSVQDVSTADMSRHFHVVADFIDSAVRAGGRVLVHCLYGVSRSVTCVLAYLMIKKGLTLKEAVRQVVQRRAIARPNDGFIYQLLALEKKLARDKMTECCSNYGDAAGNRHCGINPSKTPEHCGSCTVMVKDQNRLPYSSGPFDCSEDHIIPYPRPPPSVELRSGVLISGCQCVKKDGLQHDCPRTGCQGRAPCMAFPAPVCVPSGNAPPSLQPPEGYQEYIGNQSPRGKGARQPGKERGRHPPRSPQPSQEEYVRLAHRNYVENPPLRQCRVPCREHRKIRV